MSGVLRSEWTKLRTLRSTWWCSAVYVLVVAAFGWLAAATTPSAPGAEAAVGVALIGFAFGQVVLVVLGVLAVTGDLGGPMVLASLAAVPRRTRLLAAKTAVVTVWAALLTALLVAACVLAARTLVAVTGGVPAGDPAVLRAAGLQVAGAALVAVLGAGLGAVLRSTAGAVGLGLALVFVGPPALALAGGETASRLSQALPALRVGEDAFLAVTTPWQVGMAILAGWAAAVWVLGAALLERRDV